MIRATPFHRRTAELNQVNAWAVRGGFTVSQYYSDAHEEALAARASAVICDISFRAHLTVSGADASDFLARLATQDISQLNIGGAISALWLDDSGAVQGRGAIARLGRENFVIDAQSGASWIEGAAAPFRVSLGRGEAGLALIGPAKRHILAALGLSMQDAPSAAMAAWRGTTLTLLNLSSGMQIWCKSDDAEILWDALAKAGEDFGLIPAGLAALDILEMETTSSGDLLVDENHTGFNGRTGLLAARAGQTTMLIGLDIDDDTPAPYAQLFRQGAPVGRILSSLYSPALGRAIALAEVNMNTATAGKEFKLTVPPDAEHPAPRTIMARAVKLPFLPL